MQVSSARHYAQKTSAVRAPPDMVSLAGFCHLPHSLYRCGVCDTLPVGKLKLERTIPYTAFKYFASIAYSNSIISKNALVSIVSGKVSMVSRRFCIHLQTFLLMLWRYTRVWRRPLVERKSLHMVVPSCAATIIQTRRRRSSTSINTR